MKVLVSGASGLIGSALCPFLEERGHQVCRLVRRRSLEGKGRFFWDPAGDSVDTGAWGDPDAVVHLAGANLFSGRWNESRKEKIRESRVKGTRLIAGAVAGLPKPPEAFVSASAVGYYGDATEPGTHSGGMGGEGSIGAQERDDATEPARTEEDSCGRGFLADLCADWEKATGPAAQGGIRVVRLRIGLVLSALLQKMLLPFRLGLGGRIGRGDQHMSWISLDDLLGVINFALTNEPVHGPVNAVSPGAVTNLEFAKALGRALRRPALLPLPAALIRLVLGREMAEETVLSGVRVAPTKLLDLGFCFAHPDLEEAIRHTLLTRT